MENKGSNIFKVCAIVVTAAIVFGAGLTAAIVHKGITVKFDGAVQTNSGNVESSSAEDTSETEAVIEEVTDENGEVVTDESGEAVTEAVPAEPSSDSTQPTKNNGTTSAAPAAKTEKQQAIELYNAAAKKVKNTADANGKINMTKEHKTNPSNLNLTGKGAVDAAIKLGFTGGNGTKKYEGSDVRNRFAPDGSKYSKTRANLTEKDVKSATCKSDGNGGYIINITFAQAVNPHSDDKSGMGTVATVLMREEFSDVFDNDDNKAIRTLAGANKGDLKVDNYNLIHNGTLEAKIDKNGNLTYSKIHLNITTSGSLVYKGEQRSTSNAVITRDETFTITWG